MPRLVPTRVVGELRARLAGPGAERSLARVSCPSGKEHHRELYRIPFPAPGPEYTSFVDCDVNVESALLERVFYHEVDGVFTAPTTPDRAVVRTALLGFRHALKRHASPLTPVSLQDFPERYYGGQRLKVYRQAVDRVAITGPLRKDSYVATFLKHEKIPLLKKRAVPRVIQPRTPRYNACVGRYLRPLEHILYNDIAKVFGRPTVMKGYNAAATGALFASTWSEFARPAAVGLDASRFDQHVNVTLLEWEHLVYEMYYPGCEELRRLLSWQLKTLGFVRVPGCRFKYAVRGGRCSGDMNTALGNCLIMCAVVYALLAKHGMAGGKRTRVALFNNGDDCVLMGEERDIALLTGDVKAHFQAFGLVMKVEEVVRTLEKVSFCQTQPVYDGAAWRMCRDPRCVLSKDLYVTDRVCAMQHLSTQLHAIGECGLSLTGGLPVFQEFYSALIAHGRRGKAVDHNFRESGFVRLAHGMHEKYRLVTDAARVSFYLAFGIVPDLQCEIEQLYKSLPPPCLSPVEHGVPWEIPI